MAVWTIAAQEGTGGARLAADLAAAAHVSLLDREALARSAHQIDPNIPEADDLEATSAAGSSVSGRSIWISSGSIRKGSGKGGVG